ncbi:hypothetical protein HY310_01645 [Candidatus Microgenomates bacterium]|nr:hypothetical protein [Candidatus Microgenomates bacterium]
MDDKNILDIKPSEVLEGEVTTPADTLVTITNLIQNYIGQINDNKRVLTEHRQMIDDALNNDETYRKHTETVKEANKIKLATKKQIMSQQNMRELAEKIKELSADLKAARESLSSYLQQYKELTGSNQFENGDGEVLDIVYSAKLVRPSS